MLGNLGNLGSLDLLAAGGRCESLGQRLESLSRLDLQPGSVDGLSRALLGSLSNAVRGPCALLPSLLGLPIQVPAVPAAPDLATLRAQAGTGSGARTCARLCRCPPGNCCC